MILDVFADCAPLPAMYGARQRLVALLAAIQRSECRIRRLTIISSRDEVETANWAADHYVEYRWLRRRWRRPILSERDVRNAAASLDPRELKGDGRSGLMVYNEDLYRVCLAAGLEPAQYLGTWVDIGDLKSEIVDEPVDRGYWSSFETDLVDFRIALSTSTLADAKALDGILVRNPLPLVSAVRTMPRVGSVPRVLFVGLLEHEPNAEALGRFCEVMNAPLAIGDLELSAVGTASIATARSGGLARPLGRPSSLTSAYLDADVAVAPLVRGTGSSLKVVEALGHGVPVVASEVGARGLPLPVPGLIVPSGWEGSEWRSAIDALRTIPDSLRREMHHYAVANFGPSSTDESIRQVLRSM